ncbi:hypothetical protein P168DRAFT_60754 [Aspergillus campestris IBT 28561]|uniref:Uncharacterized protein n=1 Tax=Aspergillus campestris (strain IBT 28561) TaxID=1392248 RepID=A0A2I1CUF2_ASPC2|nr:uncharacterized protein P168DRAFT_60754 [Aspergillus campestris IBT 28561]PKY01239.1 hypothetical protein P168DRAFT_60754 [Aspergillus campestris IBT 28561]
MTTQPPHYASTFGTPHQDPSSTTPTGTHLSSANQAASEHETTGVGHQTAPLSSSHQPSSTGAGAGGSEAAKKGEQLGQGVHSAAAGIHGFGESLRGGLNAAVDKAFGHDEGVAKNANIAEKGERQVQSGHFSGH